MNLRTHSHRMCSLVVALVLLSATGIARAGEDSSNTVDFSIVASEPTAVCSMTASAIGGITATRWTTSTGQVIWDQVNASGSLTLTFNTTGGPDDRMCYTSASNTDFRNGSVQFLPANALSLTDPTSGGFPVYLGGTGHRPFMNVEVQEGGTPMNLTWYIIGWPNADAPAGSYTSTFYVTLTNTPL